MLHQSHTARIRRGIQGVVVVLVLIASFLTGSLPAAHAQGAPALFEAAAGADVPADHAISVARTRYVNVNLGLLVDASGKARDVRALPDVTLNLFPDVSYRGVIRKVEKTALNATSWIGTLAGADGGYFYLVVLDGVLIAHVASPQGIYEVSLAGGNLYRVVQIDQSKLGEDAPGKYAPPGPVLTAADLGPNADSGDRIDVMVVFTQAAQTGEGTLAALKARIALAITETNDSYANSGITTRLRLVHIQKITYTESGDLYTDLLHLADPSDGVMDNVHSLRNTYAADMVSLVVENGGANCGIADAIMATAATAFDVVVRLNCMTGYYTFGHEYGHLQGARHDFYTDPTNTPYAYGHGYVHTGSTAGTRWRTVMAYNNKCGDLGYYCTRLQYWSNDTMTAPSPYSGPLGAANSHNYTVLNNTASTVANFRTQKIWEDFTSDFNSDHIGWNPVNGTWNLASSNWYTTVGAADEWASVAHSGIYGDVTYEAKLKRTGSSTHFANALVIRGNHASLMTDKQWKYGYWFQYADDGQFCVYKRINGTLTYLQTWTASAAIVTGGWNTLKVVAVGSSLKYYINGTLVWSGSDTSRQVGNVGIEMFRDSVSTGNKLYVDSASLTTTPTADINPFHDVMPGIVIPGGDPTRSP